ncbi:MAG: M61 family peptidase [Bacteroidota bacterium]
MNYLVSIADPANHFIQLQYTIPNIHQDGIELQLPAWRPGRYELQNFAKNVRMFSVNDKNGNAVSYKKITKDRWHIETKGINEVIVSYQYYANQPDAGACYVDADFLYINPVHCFMYVEGRMDEEYLIAFDLPDDYQIACQMAGAGKHKLVAPSFDYLADSPLFASNTLRQHSFAVGDSTMHIWFQGVHPFDAERLIADTRTYTLKQVEVFGDLPCAAYHFLYLMHPGPARHGVEHLDSTVISMGQLADQTTEEYYNDLLAISSHELFHLWNIKRIRPVELFPYDFTKENYSTLGYVYEGVTTYYGDLMLMQSGVWSWEQYATSFNSDLKRHLDNPGRFNYSVAESSWDTWLDGYVPGVAGRKVSIYIEGMIAAVIADILIIKNSDGKHSLHQVMHDLYQQYYKHHKGYDEAVYRSLLEKYAGISFETYFKDLVWGKAQLQHALEEALTAVGCALKKDSSGGLQLHKLGNTNALQNKLFAKWTGSNE